jgi:hypothetical protein
MFKHHGVVASLGWLLRAADITDAETKLSKSTRNPWADVLVEE